MDFSDTPEEQRFRLEARKWLEQNVPTREELLAQSNDIERCKLWQKRKYDANWACIRWPEEYGGRGASAIESVIWNQEESKHPVPAGVFEIGQGMAGPTLMAWGTEEQKQKYLPPLASGEHIWCQLFSEPVAGSDLAGLRTKAERDGDDWVVNGQKIWTSGAHFSNYGILVVRTDPEVPKHQGLTYFMVDMKTPGIEVRQIKQISGAAYFNEVFFTDVRIPDSYRLGKVGDGWKVSITTLMNERAVISGTVGGVNFERLLRLVQNLNLDDRPAIENAHVRAMLANWYCQESGLRYTGYRSLTALSRGEIPGPENSIGKLVGAPKSQEMASFALDLMEMCGALEDVDDARYFQSFLNSPGARIAGGSDEIMLNILAERVLGLPQDIRVDKGIPFSQVPTSPND